MLVGTTPSACWADRVETRPGATPLLARPDGYLVWTGGTDLEDALSRWFGTAARHDMPPELVVQH